MSDCYEIKLRTKCIFFHSVMEAFTAKAVNCIKSSATKGLRMCAFVLLDNLKEDSEHNYQMILCSDQD